MVHGDNWGKWGRQGCLEGKRSQIRLERKGGGLDPGGGGGVRAGGGLTVLLANERHSARYTQSNDFVAKFVSTKRRYQVRFHRDRLFNVNRSLTP